MILSEVAKVGSNKQATICQELTRQELAWRSKFVMKRSGAQSLGLDLTVQSQFRPGQQWCEVQGSVDKETFLQWNRESNEVKLLGPLGEKVKAIRTWTEWPQMLATVNLGGEKSTVCREDCSPYVCRDTSDCGRRRSSQRQDDTPVCASRIHPPCRQAELCCQREAKRCSAVSRKLTFNGQTVLLSDPISMNWTLVLPGARGVKEDWEDSKDLVEHFRKISMGDCND
ncbi:retinoic acid early transcript 1E-like [Sturnira hondurensis]|uniref:retinoic acid early transcript 1E-like n=1 Tax=Sturnira hondurensis TaxID=192404 RepID=UPI001879C787|nr:retinoic acid early transcript 1E-like [Sturnira hondurensis]